MMRATGTLFLGNTKPLATMAADGTFALTLLAYDRIAAHKVEAWRITYSGAPAQEFWATAQAQLTPGQPIEVEACHVRTFLHGRFSTPEVHSQVARMALAPRAPTN